MSDESEEVESGSEEQEEVSDVEDGEDEGPELDENGEPVKELPSDCEGSEWESKVSDREVREVIRDLGKEESDTDTGYKPNDARCRKIKHIVREYAQMSTMHGMNHLGEAHTCRVIVFWSLMLLICLLLFLYLFNDTGGRYIKYESAVEISLETQTQTFPSVSLCNLSPYTLTGLESVDELRALVLAYDYAINNKIRDIRTWNADVDDGVCDTSCNY